MEQLFTTSAADALASLRHNLEKEHVPRLIQCIVEALKNSADQAIQRRAARSMARVMELLSSRTPNTNGKRAKIMANMLMSDPQAIPQLASHVPSQQPMGILTVILQIENEEIEKSKRKKKKPVIADTGSDVEEDPEFAAAIEIAESSDTPNKTSVVARRSSSDSILCS
jgi:hypothetical protein